VFRRATAKAFKQRGTREATGTKLCFAKALCLFAIFCEILISGELKREEEDPKRRLTDEGVRPMQISLSANESLLDSLA
jgi:hypothetical protein